MSVQITKTNKIELSDEQLETVAGGTVINAVDASYFAKLTEARQAETTATGHGASTSSTAFRDQTLSSALSGLFVG